MLFRKREGPAVLVEEPVAVPPEPSLAEDERAEYCRVAKAIGFTNGAFLEERLKTFLVENGICVYPEEKVVQYLNSKFGRSRWFKSTWCWRPLREEDKKANLNNSVKGNGRIYNADGWYGGPVPLPVMLTVEKIHNAFSEACFYVSDSIPSQHGDPFLMVIAIGINGMVIERWGEPSFRM